MEFGHQEWHAEMKTKMGQFHDCQKPQKLQNRPWPDSLYYFSVSMTKYQDERQPKEQRAYSDLWFQRDKSP